ncbi:glycosyl transferase [Candidatus Omnitrophota bacterium]
MNYNFCTYFDSNYLAKGLALYDSLKGYCPGFRLWVLCMDDHARVILEEMALPEIEIIALKDFENADEELLQAKKNRNRVEYYFTCTPSLPLYIFKNFPEVDLITYVDADIYFFNDPKPVFEEINGHSIAIIEHRFSLRNMKNLIQGIYNVGWLSFRRDVNAMVCLKWWRDKCNEWCYDRVDGGLFADQKYMDDWPQHFKGVVVLKHKGVNLAIWNMDNYDINVRTNKVFVDEQSLIFFHFHGFRHILWKFYATGARFYRVRINRACRHFIYEPYLKKLSGINRDLLNRFGVSFNERIR